MGFLGKPTTSQSLSGPDVQRVELSNSERGRSPKRAMAEIKRYGFIATGPQCLQGIVLPTIPTSARSVKTGH